MNRAGRPSGTRTQADRTLDMRAALVEAYPLPLTAREMTERLGVTERTVRRDMAIFERRGDAFRSERRAEWTWEPTTDERLLVQIERTPMTAAERQSANRLLRRIRLRRAG